MPITDAELASEFISSRRLRRCENDGFQNMKADIPAAISAATPSIAARPSYIIHDKWRDERGVNSAHAQRREVDSLRNAARRPCEADADGDINDQRHWLAYAAVCLCRKIGAMAEAAAAQ